MIKSYRFDSSALIYREGLRVISFILWQYIRRDECNLAGFSFKEHRPDSKEYHFVFRGKADMMSAYATIIIPAH